MAPGVPAATRRDPVRAGDQDAPLDRPRRTAKPVAAAKPKPPAHPGYRDAIAAFDGEFRAAFGSAYPWAFGVRDGDAPRVKAWLEVARVDAADPGPGVERIRVASRAYLRAVEARKAFPYNEPATTRWFTRDLAKWLQTDPDAQPGHSTLASREDDRHAALDMLRQARLRLVE